MSCRWRVALRSTHPTRSTVSKPIAGGSWSARGAHIIDEMVRAAPERAYDTEFFEEFTAKAGWRLGMT